MLKQIWNLHLIFYEVNHKPILLAPLHINYTFRSNNWSDKLMIMDTFSILNQRDQQNIQQVNENLMF